MVTLYVREASMYREASADDVLRSAQQFMNQKFHKGARVFSSPSLTREFLRIHLAAQEREVFGLLHLTARHRLIRVEDLFFGTIDGAAVHPREVVRSVLVHNAAAVICYHNHPGGDPRPSSADEMVTRRLKEALALIEVRLLDHLIIGETVYSFKEAGQL